MATNSNPSASASTTRFLYKPDPPHTFVVFEVRHALTSTVRGRFDHVDGVVELDFAANAGRIDITIDTGSISTGTPKFDGHLRSADFFDVEHHPVARYFATRLHFYGDKLTEVDGELTLHGHTHPVRLTGTSFNCFHAASLDAHVCGGDFETTIQRSRWGLTWGLDIGVPDAVKLLISIEAVRQP